MPCPTPSLPKKEREDDGDYQAMSKKPSINSAIPTIAINRVRKRSPRY